MILSVFAGSKKLFIIMVQGKFLVATTLNLNSLFEIKSETLDEPGDY